MNNRFQLIAAAAVLLALIIAPAPLLPPFALTEIAAGKFALGWEAAYLVTAVGLQSIFYFAIGLLAALSMNRATTLRGLLVQVISLPTAIIAVSILIRSFKAGHLPIWVNAAVPICACIFGVALGIGLLHRSVRAMALAALCVVALCVWAFTSSPSNQVSIATVARLQRIVAAGPTLPAGDARFAALMQTTFSSSSLDPPTLSITDQNRAAILALGIAVGHPRLARRIGLDPDSDVVVRSAEVCQGATLSGRVDWARHFSLSAGLAVFSNALVSDAGGLMKEQLDALSNGSGFSFRDLAADRAGIRFAEVATSKASAKSLQTRLQQRFSAVDYFPPADNVNQFSENLSVDQFRRDFGSVGSERYRQEIRKIDGMLDSCAALSIP